MKNSFAKLGENILTRKFGGTNFGVADPYLTGYHFIWFENLPENLMAYIPGSNISNQGEVGNILSASCLSVTPPGGTLNRVEFTGLGGVKWSVPGNIDYGTSVSVKFLEFSGTPILNIMHSWVKMIRDYRTGISEVLEADTNTFSKKDFAAVMYYWTTAPDGMSIEYYACYDGVFPTKDPQDLFASDVETVGRLDIDIEFNVDYAWREPWVYNKCKDFASAFAPMARTVVTSYEE